MASDMYNTLRGHGPKRMLHYEHWSNPDAETWITGIDYYDHPRLCRLKWNEMYPLVPLGVPAEDTPRPRPALDRERSANHEAHSVRWGDGQTATYLHGEAFFKTPEDVWRFSPLEHAAKFPEWPHVVMNWDFSSEEAIIEKRFGSYTLDTAAPEGEAPMTGFYNTMFMWPMLTFGWELFLECCLDPRFERIMGEFLEINRRVFRVFARLPVYCVVCHDDIVMSRGPVCSPPWMKKFIYSAYEELWGILAAGGKKVHFMADGNMDECADDVMALGAIGIITEPYTDFKRLARKYPNGSFAGEGDNRILFRNNDAEIKAMVKSMAETGKMCGGYFMCIGNHIPWDIPGEAIKRYLDYSNEYAWR